MTTLEHPVPHVSMKPEEFIAFAQAQHWDDRSIQLLVKPPIIPKPFLIGRTKDRRLVTLVGNGLDFRR